MDKPNFEHYTIDTWELFERLVAYEEKCPTSNKMFYDVETDSLVIKRVRLFGIGICFNLKKTFYVTWRNQAEDVIWPKEQQDKIISWILSTAKKRGIIGHNISYDVLVTEQTMGIVLGDYIYADTQALKHTVSEEKPFSLKEISRVVLGEWAVESQDDLKSSVIANGGRWLKEDKDIYKGDTAIISKYCGYDVLLTHLIFDFYSIKLKEENLEDFFYNLEVMKLYKLVLIPAKRKGFPVDVAHFERLKSEIEKDINKLHDEVQEEIKEEVEPFVAKLLDEEFPIKSAGNFPKAVAEFLEIPLPLSKKKSKETGEITFSTTLSKAAIEKQKEASPNHGWFYDWIIENDPIKTPIQILKNRFKIQSEMWLKRYQTSTIFNLNSTDHLAAWLVEIRGYKADKTETGKWQINDEFIEELKSTDPITQKLQDYKKLCKLRSTYVDGILDRVVDDTIFTDFLIHGTTSGRLSSRNPNCQNLPRPREEGELSPLVAKYANEIRAGFVAKSGYKIIDCDYGQLEVCCFAHMSNEEGLRSAIKNGEDIYSKIAIQVNNLTQYSAHKKAPNYLKNMEPTLRQLWKIPTLGIVYGMEEGRLVQSIGCSYDEARDIIQGYLSTYPNLRKYMNRCDFEVKKLGKVVTELGRPRHLPDAKILYDKYGNDLLDKKWAKSRGLELERWKFKRALNNAKNHKIQGLAAHLINRASIAIMEEFKKININGYIGFQVHDQLCVIVEDFDVDRAKEIVQRCMEQTTKISVPLTAEPQVAINLKEGH